MNEHQPHDPAAALVTPRGLPARVGRLATGERAPCPGCAAPPSRRVRSGGFGQNHDLCGNCGYAFDELTVGMGR